MKLNVEDIMKMRKEQEFRQEIRQGRNGIRRQTGQEFGKKIL